MLTKTDAQIQSQVMQELRWDTRVKETDIGVAVQDGVVTLNGTVDSWAGRLAAERAAHRVSGVLDVANDVVVKLPGTLSRTDSDIAHAVRHALDWDVLVPGQRIRSTVSKGVVTLEGSVDTWSQFDDAGRAIRNLAGVREVKNLLDVKPPTVPERSVRASIDEALGRHAEHAAKHVRIAIEADKVTLSGEVPSWAEREAVEGAVRGTRGVHKVENHLVIHA